jgi:hypothetical protein
MASGSIVEHLDVVEDISFGEVSRFVDSFSDSLFLQAAEERFRDSVDAPMSSKPR